MIRAWTGDEGPHVGPTRKWPHLRAWIGDFHCSRIPSQFPSLDGFIGPGSRVRSGFPSLYGKNDENVRGGR